MTIRRYALIAVLMVVRTYEVRAITVDEWAPFTQPDGTTFIGHVYGDEIEVNRETADGYAFVYNPADDYLYYAELDSNGDYRPSSAKVGIDDPVAHSIPKHLQRSAIRQATLQATRIAQGYVKTPVEEGVTGQFGDPAHAPCTGASPCDVYVVMVSFADSRSNNVYGRNDQPWSYPMALFEQFFSGGYEGVPAYTGTIAHTSASHAAPTVAENATGAVGQYTVGGAGCGSVAWLALGGADASAFALQGVGASRSLHFRTTPDYEPTYQVEVRAYGVMTITLTTGPSAKKTDS